MQGMSSVEVKRLKEWLDRQLSIAIENSAGRGDTVGYIFTGKADAYSQIIDWLEVHTEDMND